MDYEDKSKEQIIAELVELRESYQKEITKCRQTEDEFINFINLSSDAFILVGLDGKIKRINLTFCKTILGCNPEELVGRSCIEFINSFVHPDDLSKTIKVAQNAIKGEYDNLENRYLCKDGSIKWYKWTHTPLVNTELYYGVGHDITQQKIAEGKLKKSNDQINNILESIGDAFFALDSQWKFIYFNKEAERIYKRKSQEVIGKNIWDEFPSYIGTDYQKNYFKSMNDRVVIHTESKGIHSNEWVEVHIYPSNDGISVYYRDISERKRMEIALHESEERYRKLVELSPDTIIVHYKGNIIFTNEAGANLLGYKKPEEVYGKNLLEFFHPDYPESSKTRYHLVLEGNTVQFMEIRMVRSDGTIIDVESAAVPLIYQGRKYIQVVIRDITSQKAESKRAQDLLLNQFRQMSTIFDSINALIYVVDMENYELLFINKYGLDLFGLDIVGKPCFQVLQSDQVEPCAFCTNKLLTRDGLPLETYVWECKNTVCNRWFQCIDRAITWVDGRLVRVEIAFDITERKNMEESLRESEERYRILFTNTNDSIFVYGLTSHNLPGKFIEVNDVACKSLGYKREELLNLLPNDIKYTDKPFELANTINKLITEKHVLYESVNIAKDARKIPVEVNANLFDLNGESIILAIDRDITERKKAVEVLETERKRLFSLLDGLPGIVYLRDSNYNVHFSNQYFWNLFGKPRNNRCYEVIHNRKEPCKECPSDRVFNTNTSQTWENSYTNGKTFEIYTYPFQDINGSPLVLNLLIDITERKQFEKEMARLSKLNLIGEMAAGIAHEVRNPMTTVRGFLQLLGNKKEYVQYKEYHELMIEELDRANSIITEFLSLAKDKVDYLEVRSLNSIIEIMYPLINAEAMNSGKDVRIDYGNIPELLLNEKEIRQLLLNLIQNGLESMDTGGCLDIKTFVEGGEVVLKVKDQGSGISHELLEKIGTPFFTTKANGTGLGLATCYSIAKRHNARIDVETGSKGTIFSVRFKVPI